MALVNKNTLSSSLNDSIFMLRYSKNTSLDIRKVNILQVLMTSRYKRHCLKTQNNF